MYVRHSDCASGDPATQGLKAGWIINTASVMAENTDIGLAAYCPRRRRWRARPHAGAGTW
jgi:hypothetical protein